MKDNLKYNDDSKLSGGRNKFKVAENPQRSNSGSGNCNLYNFLIFGFIELCIVKI